MRVILSCILLFGSLIFSYSDWELDSLWDCLSDVNNPTLEDYKLVEDYLKNGIRPYLDTLYNTTSLWGWPPHLINPRIETWRNFKLIGPNEEKPVFEHHQVDLSEETKDRCVLLYASYNRSYPQKLYRILEELKTCGYSGNVMIRVGGFPNLSEGGLKACPLWTLWKQEFIKEALRMGFTKVVTLDTSMHPLTNLNSIFNAIETRGYYFMYSKQGSLQYLPSFAHLNYLKYPRELTNEIPWLPGYILGFNLVHPEGAKVFYDWDRAMRRIEEFFCLGWEEIILTILAWQNHLEPIDSYDNCVCEGTFSSVHPSSSHLFFFRYDEKLTSNLRVNIALIR